MSSLCLLIVLPAVAAGYDPLDVPDAEPQTREFVVTDAARQREIPVLVYRPAEEGPRPVVLFSHGLGGSRRGCAYLGRHWAGRGYAAVFVQHPGSDEAVWKDERPQDRRAALLKQANAAQFRARLQDVPAVLDQLDRWAAEAGHPLHGAIDVSRVGMSGHSFGAKTTQMLSGQSARLGGRVLGGRRSSADGRIVAAIAMSPSPPAGPRAGGAFADVTIPWLLMTGTRDSDPITAAGRAPLDRRDVYEGIPESTAKYELVLDGGVHSTFTDQNRRGDAGPKNPAHHRTILALSTAFWDAHLRGDEEARRWLDGAGVRTVLSADDEWQTSAAAAVPADASPDAGPHTDR